VGFGSGQITASSAEDLIDRFITAISPGLQNEHSTSRPSARGQAVIQIDIDADLVLVDDEDR
jgi:hypothetical protein